MSFFFYILKKICIFKGQNEQDMEEMEEIEEIEEIDFSLGEVGGIEADFGFDMDFSFDFQTDEQLESRILKPKINADGKSGQVR